MNIRAFGKTDIGIIRENNEDNFLIMNISTSEEGDDGVKNESIWFDAGEYESINNDDVDNE